MTVSAEKLSQLCNFREKTTLGLTIIALVILPPFCINNLIQGRYPVGIGILAIVMILVVHTWCIFNGRFYPSLNLYGLLPAILLSLTLSIHTQGIIGVLWCYPAVASFYFMLPERKAWLANAALAAVTLPQAWVVLDNAMVVRVVATLLAISIFSVIFIRIISIQQEKMQALAETDPLTGLLNRTRLHDTLEQAMHQYKRTGVPMTLISFDLDHFKQINDTLGHDAGDEVLSGFGTFLRKRLRRVDRAFRLGGEEFLALLYGTDAENGRRVAQELCHTISLIPLLPNRLVTVSIGAATLKPDEDWTAWMKRSDEHLYCAKKQGRNRAVTDLCLTTTTNKHLQRSDPGQVQKKLSVQIVHKDIGNGTAYMSNDEFAYPVRSSESEKLYLMKA